MLALGLGLVSLALGMDFVLPPGEDPLLWQSPLALGGFTAVPAASGAHVEVVAGAVWEIRVWDAKGMLRTATLPPPKNSRDREDLSLLAASLMRPLTPQDSWSIPPLPSKPPPNYPPPAIQFETPALLEPPLQLSALEPVKENSPFLPVEVPLLELSWSQGPWLALSQQLSFRTGFNPVLGLQIRGGYQKDALAAAVGLGFLPEATLQQTVLLENSFRMRDFFGELGLYWHPIPVQAFPRIGLVGELSWRTFINKYESVDLLVGSAGGELAWPITITGPFKIVPYALIQVEPPNSEIKKAGVVLETVSPLRLAAGLTIHLQLERQVVSTAPDRSGAVPALSP